MERRLHRLAAALIVTCTVFCTVGCFRRTLEVRSDPPGAEVWIDGVAVGATPLERDFTFYGTVDVEIRKRGGEQSYRAAHVEKRLIAPWYEFVPIDLITEFLVPVPIQDLHRVDVQLEPYPAQEREEVDDLDGGAGERDDTDNTKPLDRQAIARDIARLQAMLSAGERSPPEDADAPTADETDR